MSKIPWNDIESYKVACAQLLIEYDEHIKDHVRKAYLNGDPSDLGSHCSHRPGENMSTNAAESRGKEHQKGQTSALSSEADPDEESKNPIHMIAGAGIDADKHMSLSDPLKDFAVNAPRNKFIESALNELRKISSYRPPPTLTNSSRNVQKFLNLSGTFLYSIVTVNGLETPHESVLGNKRVESFTIHFPTTSRLFTSLSLYMLNDIAKFDQAPAGMYSRFASEDAKDVQKLISHLSTLRPNETKDLYQMLAQKRRENTPELQPGENATMFLIRRSQRKVDPKWAEPPRHPSRKGAKGKTGKGGKGKGGKGKAKSAKASEDFEQLNQEKLEREKDAGEVEVVSSVKASRPKTDVFVSEELPIDGEGGILEVAMTEGLKSDGLKSDEGLKSASDASVPHDRETLRDRIRLKRELGDWVETQFILGSKDERMQITCNCEDYSKWGCCEHCIYIEVLHRGEFDFVSRGNEQWQDNRKKALHNIETQCGRVRSSK